MCVISLDRKSISNSSIYLIELFYIILKVCIHPFQKIIYFSFNHFRMCKIYCDIIKANIFVMINSISEFTYGLQSICYFRSIIGYWFIWEAFYYMTRNKSIMSIFKKACPKTKCLFRYNFSWSNCTSYISFCLNNLLSHSKFWGKSVITHKSIFLRYNPRIITKIIGQSIIDRVSKKSLKQIQNWVKCLSDHDVGHIKFFCSIFRIPTTN